MVVIVSRGDVFVLGDLNVDGDQLDWENWHNSNPGYGSGGPCSSDNLWEWILRFDSQGSFFSDFLKDAWVFEQAPYTSEYAFDRGLSQGLPVQGERLDYVLRNRPVSPVTVSVPPLSVQHLTLEHGLMKDAEGHFMSDHLGVCADVNRQIPYCNPVDAYVPPVDNTPVPGNIPYKGSLQWYRVDERGTYLFAVTGTNMRYDVYVSKDLSNPVPQYFGETGDIVLEGGRIIEGGKYLLPEAPFYIRVHHKDRSGTGPYSFVAHKMQGASKKDAIVLRANDWYEYNFPPWQPLNPDDTAWFELPIEKPYTGAPQQLRFMVANYPSSADVLELYLADKDGTTQLDEDVESEPDPNPPQMAGSRLLLIQRDDLGSDAGKLYLKVKRTEIWPVSFWIRWETNLTVLHGQDAGVPGACPLMVFCGEETDAGIDDLDEVYLTVDVDGQNKVNEVYIGQFDDDYTSVIEGHVGIVRFLNQVRIQLRDSDGGFYGDDDFFVWTIGTLGPDQTEALGESQAIADNDGEYILSWNRSRTLMK